MHMQEVAREINSWHLEKARIEHVVQSCYQSLQLERIDREVNM